ncbi:hypothetical protein [Lacticaseibacillus manihotivorans]|uniref:hypothetical protein n=1 Tax=Lacticaseibacillus manihotivorans TaxID=88233 RepID=UPI0006D2C06F|nr:hypothetical protein [Lacticaseibacillus manihotivorans]
MLLDARLLYENYFGDMQAQLFDRFNRHLAQAQSTTPETIKIALDDALAHAPKQPLGRYCMIQGSLISRAAMHLVNQATLGPKSTRCSTSKKSPPM